MSRKSRYALTAPSFLLSVILFSGLSGCASESGKKVSDSRRPNILWIIGENMGPDLGCYRAPAAQTPNLDRLAGEGLRFNRAFATSPVCSSSRSAFMTGMYQTAIGAHNHRSHRTDYYPLPPGVRPVTSRFRDAGYYTANVRTMGGKAVGTGKTDLNFDVDGEPVHTTVRISGSAPRNQPEDHARQNEARLFETDNWDDLRDHQPFFAQVNLPVVEAGGGRGWTGSSDNPWEGTSHPSVVDPDEVSPPPYYPDHEITRREWAAYLDAVGGVDLRTGEILERLAGDGLAENTVVIFFGDNGRLTLRGLDWCYDSGDRVPLIIRWPEGIPAPEQYQPGAVNDQLVSLIDITATTLEIAGVRKPGKMHGRVLIGPNAEPEPPYVVSARDRCDESVNRIRALRTPRYRYIRNFMPDKPFMALHRYKAQVYPVMRLMFALHQEGKLTPVQQRLMAPRLPDEELYDLDNDPYEIHNLAASGEGEHPQVLVELRGELERWIEQTNDQGRSPESPEVIDYWTREQTELHGEPDWWRPPR